MILKFKVIEQTLFPYPTNGIPRAGSRDYLQLDFDFCEGTEGYVKTVYFFAENREVEGEGVGNYSSAEVYQGEPITVDAFFAQGDFSISVGLVDGGVSYSTNEVSIPLDPASDIWLQLPPNLEIPAYQQLVQLAQSASASADQAATNAADAISAAEDALQKAEEVHDLAATAGGAASSAASAAEAAEKAAAAAAEEAEEARLLAEDAEQTAITAISMGNHIIRADTSDGVSYVAERSATLPAIAVGSGGTHKGKGTRIVFIPGGKNTVAVPTLCIDDRDIIPIRLRSAANKGDNDQAPDATDDIPVGALMAGVPYAMTFCGKYWLMDSLIGGIGGGKTYVRDTQPEGMKPGDTWVDTSVELEEPVTEAQLEEHVEEAVSGLGPADITDTVNEILYADGNEAVPEEVMTLSLAGQLIARLKSGDFISHGGIGQYNLYWDDAYMMGGIRMRFANYRLDLQYVERVETLFGRMTANGDSGNKVYYVVGGNISAYSITGLAEPTEDSGAANKKYVDDAIAAAFDGIALAEEGSY